MIRYYETHLELTPHAAAALLQFASKDTTRRHLGVGIDNGAVCATDGHTLLSFDAACVLDEQGKPAKLDALHGKVWPRAYVEQQSKLAKALKAPMVRLDVSSLADEKFPPCSQVVPAFELSAKRPIGFNPAYVGQLAAVAKACACAGALLVAANGELDPLAFRVVGPDLQATAVVMPMRI